MGWLLFTCDKCLPLYTCSAWILKPVCILEIYAKLFLISISTFDLDYETVVYGWKGQYELLASVPLDSWVTCFGNFEIWQESVIHSNMSHGRTYLSPQTSGFNRFLWNTAHTLIYGYLVRWYSLAMEEMGIFYQSRIHPLKMTQRFEQLLPSSLWGN